MAIGARSACDSQAAYYQVFEKKVGVPDGRPGVPEPCQGWVVVLWWSMAISAGQKNSRK